MCHPDTMGLHRMASHVRIITHITVVEVGDLLLIRGGAIGQHLVDGFGQASHVELPRLPPRG